MSRAAEASALELTVAVLRPLLAAPDVTELCINRPGEAFVETARGWHRAALPLADFDWCRRFAKLVAHATWQRVDEAAPLLSASLPDGERAQFVLPPATRDRCVALAVRRPADRCWSLEELAGRGALRETRAGGPPPAALERRLVEHLAAGDHVAFLRAAVRARLNILVSGATGSGKTTWTKALIGEIPADERLISIEDADELVLDAHPNHVRLYYSKDRQGAAGVTPRRLLEACLRMRPDRILLAELRGDEAFDYLRNVNSGHPGSITSVHAGSCALAFEQLALLVKQSDGGRGLARGEIMDLLHLSVDVVVQCARRAGERVVSEIWYRPDLRRRAAGADG